MELLIVGVGPGDPMLLTLAGYEAIRTAPLIAVVQTLKTDGVLLPRGRAEEVVLFHRPDAPLWRLPVPMTRDAARRDAGLLEQLELNRHRWQGLSRVVLPVLGDPLLYATTAYLARCWETLTDVTCRFVPGVSAHSVLACAAGVSFAQDDEIFAVVPGSADEERRRAVMAAADCVALYKAASLGDLSELAHATGPWAELWRGDDLSAPTERVEEGPTTLEQGRPYMSTLLWRKERRHD